jgi:hypothetical protein
MPEEESKKCQDPSEGSEEQYLSFQQKEPWIGATQHAVSRKLSLDGQ